MTRMPRASTATIVVSGAAPEAAACPITTGSAHGPPVKCETFIPVNTAPVAS